jgi:hypothetical protein
MALEFGVKRDPIEAAKWQRKAVPYTHPLFSVT